MDVRIENETEVESVVKPAPPRPTLLADSIPTALPSFHLLPPLHRSPHTEASATEERAGAPVAIGLYDEVLITHAQRIPRVWFEGLKGS